MEADGSKLQPTCRVLFVRQTCCWITAEAVPGNSFKNHLASGWDKRCKRFHQQEGVGYTVTRVIFCVRLRGELRTFLCVCRERQATPAVLRVWLPELDCVEIEMLVHNARLSRRR